MTHNEGPKKYYALSFTTKSKKVCLDSVTSAADITHIRVFGLPFHHHPAAVDKYIYQWVLDLGVMPEGVVKVTELTEREYLRLTTM